LVCESKVGFSMSALTKTHKWFFNWKGLTLTPPLPIFFLMISIREPVIWSTT
jgi:hypothetical protein